MLETADQTDDDLPHTETIVPAFIRQVGSRVQDIRKSQRLSRRALSERSGVSPRYLAKLEAGDGNISIGLLKKVALALETPIAFLLTEEAAQDDAFREIADLYRRADTATRARVLQALNPDKMRAQKAQRVCLVGLRGAGKSTLGALVGKECNAPFIELNTAIEKSAGVPISEIIALYGQEGYRQLEADTLSEIVATYPRAVVAVAGGIVSEPETYRQLLAQFHTVWVKTSPREHMDRVRAQGDMRPMEGNPQAMIQLRQILKAREALYAQADHHLETSGKSVSDSLAELEAVIRSFQLLGAGPAL